MACVQTDILQPIAGIVDIQTLSDIQDHNNRTAFDWLDRLTRLFRCDTRDPGVGDDVKDGIVPSTIWINTSTNSAFINVDNTAGSAVWQSVTGGGSVVSDKSTSLSYNEASSVPYNTLTTILTLSPSSDTYVSQIECSGEIYGKFELYYNSSLVGTRRGGPDRDVTFIFDTPWTIANGDTLDVKVIHFANGKTPTFESGVWGFT